MTQKWIIWSERSKCWYCELELYDSGSSSVADFMLQVLDLRILQQSSKQHRMLAALLVQGKEHKCVYFTATYSVP
jgi:hypothetical protein